MNEDNQQPKVRLPDDTIALGVQVGDIVLRHQLNQIGPMWQQAFQVVQKKSPQQPLDPAIAKTFEAAMAEIQRKTAVDKSDAQIAMQKFQHDVQSSGQKFQLDASAQQFEQQVTLKSMQDELAKQAQEFQTKMAEAHQQSQMFMQELQKERTAEQEKIQLEYAKLAEHTNALPSPDVTKHLQDLGNLIKSMVDGQSSIHDSLHNTMQGIGQMMNHMNAPTEIIRDQNGRPVGMRKVARSVQVIGG